MKYILLIVMFLFYNNLFSQECNYKKDTLFLVFVGATPKNNSPKTISFLIKNIGNIKISNNSWRSFIDTLFTSAVYSQYVFLGFINKTDCYRDSADDFLDNLIGEFIKQEKKMLKNEKYILKKGMLKDSSIITISCIKVAGEFWKLTDIRNINTITHQAHINLATYKFNYYYVFKKIDDSWKISKEERIALKNKFIKAGVKLKNKKKL